MTPLGEIILCPLEKNKNPIPSLAFECARIARICFNVIIKRMSRRALRVLCICNAVSLKAIGYISCCSSTGVTSRQSNLRDYRILIPNQYVTLFDMLLQPKTVISKEGEKLDNTKK